MVPEALFVLSVEVAVAGALVLLSAATFSVALLVSGAALSVPPVVSPSEDLPSSFFEPGVARL